MKRDFLFALSTLIGLTIGAGIFGIPYVVSKSGIITGLFYFFILGGIACLMHLIFGEITLRTKERHRLVGFVEKYLGKGAKNLIAITTLLGIVGVLLAYLILGGNFLKTVSSPFLNLSSLNSTLLFWFFLSIFVFLGIKFIAPLEVFTNFFFISILLIILFLSFIKFKISNLPTFSLNNFFVPYGVILFSFFALEAVPESGEILKEKKNLKNTILFNTLIVGLIYFLFALSVIGVSGKSTSQDALSGLIPYLGERVITFGALAALITILDSFLVLATFLKNTLIYDFKIPKIFASLFTSGFPLILFLSGFQNFIKVIGFVGAFIGLIDGMAIIFVYKRARVLGDREPDYTLNLPDFVLYLLIAILILGAISQIYYEIHR